MGSVNQGSERSPQGDKGSLRQCELGEGRKGERRWLQVAGGTLVGVGAGEPGGTGGSLCSLLSLVILSCFSRAAVPNLLAPGTSFMKDNVPLNITGGWFGDDSCKSTLHLLCTLFLLLIPCDI